MIAILSADRILSEMLQIEIKRGGFLRSEPQTAKLWLLDFDHPPRPLPKHTAAHTVIGLGTAGRKGVDLCLPLPYDSKELQTLLADCLKTSTTAMQTVTYLPRLVIVNDQKLHLSPTEDRIFSLLWKNRGKTVSENTLIAALGETNADTNVLPVHIYRLRRKLSGKGVSMIRSERGKGYRLC